MPDTLAKENPAAKMSSVVIAHYSSFFSTHPCAFTQIFRLIKGERSSLSLLLLPALGFVRPRHLCSSSLEV